MLLIITALLTATVTLRVLRVRAAGEANAVDLGWMSQQWLAEHRAAHPS